MKEIIKKIKKYNTIIIHGHERPDGDCLGSQIGLKDIIKSTWPDKNVYIVGENSDYLSFLGKTDEVSDSLYEGALAIVVDLANKDRASDKRFDKADYVIKIDHHVNIEQYANYEYVDDKCSSCSEIICRLYKKFKLKMTLKGAEALYTGIVTDTGRYRYDSITGDTLRTGAMLLDLGVNPAKLDNLLSVDTVDTLKLKGYVYSNFITYNNFAYIKMTRDVIKQHNVTDEQAANMINLLSTIEGVLTWALIIEYADGSIKVRLRSKGPAINEFAAKYNGGGHAKASGAKLESWDQVDQFVKDINELNEQYLKNNK